MIKTPLDTVYYQYSITAENLTFEIMIEKNTMLPARPMTNLTGHTHPYLEIFVCQQDQIYINSNDGVVELHKGDAAIVPPFIPHFGPMTHDNAVWQAMAFSFHRQPVRECQDLYSLFEPYITNPNIIVFHNVPELISSVYEILQDYNSNNRFVPGLHLLYLLSKLSEKNQLTLRVEQAETQVEDSNLVRMNRLDRIINTEFMQNLTADAIADKLHISSRQLSRIVQKRYHATLHQVITDKRIAVAAKMLQSSDFSAEKIAEMVGYTSRASFYKEFDKKYGMTPLEYRKDSNMDEQE